MPKRRTKRTPPAKRGLRSNPRGTLSAPVGPFEDELAELCRGDDGAVNLMQLQACRDLPAEPEVLEKRMKKALGSKLDDETAGHYQWAVGMYGKALMVLVKSMRELALGAADENIQRTAGRVLGKLYRQVTSNTEVAELCANDEFKHLVGKGAGREPAPGLRKWIEREMGKICEYWAWAVVSSYVVKKPDPAGMRAAAVMHFNGAMRTRAAALRHFDAHKSVYEKINTLGKSFRDAILEIERHPGARYDVETMPDKLKVATGWNSLMSDGEKEAWKQEWQSVADDLRRNLPNFEKNLRDVILEIERHPGARYDVETMPDKLKAALDWNSLLSEGEKENWKKTWQSVADDYRDNFPNFIGLDHKTLWPPETMTLSKRFMSFWKSGLVVELRKRWEAQMQTGELEKLIPKLHDQSHSFVKLIGDSKHLMAGGKVAAVIWKRVWVPKKHEIIGNSDSLQQTLDSKLSEQDE